MPAKKPKPKPQKSESLMSITAEVMECNRRLEWYLEQGHYQGNEIADGDLEEYIAELFQGPKEQLIEKVRSYCWLITSLRANAEKFEDRASALQARAEADTKKADYLTDKMARAFDMIGLEGLDVGDFYPKFKNAGGVLRVEVCSLWQTDIASVPKQFIRQPPPTIHEPEIDKDKLREHIEKNGPILLTPKDPNDGPPVVLAGFAKRGKKLVIK